MGCCKVVNACEELTPFDLFVRFEYDGVITYPHSVLANLYKKNPVGSCVFDKVCGDIVPLLEDNTYYIGGRIFSYNIDDVGTYKVEWVFNLFDGGPFYSYSYLFSIIL